MVEQALDWDLGHLGTNHGIITCDMSPCRATYYIIRDLVFTQSSLRYSLSTYHVQEPPRGYRCVKKKYPCPHGLELTA